MRRLLLCVLLAGCNAGGLDLDGERPGTAAPGAPKADGEPDAAVPTCATRPDPGPPASPFEAAAWLVGTTDEGACGADALVRFWPALGDSYLSGFDCGARFYVLDDEGAAHYASERGITVAGLAAATPPCGDAVAPRFGLDGRGLLHYQCGDSLYRGAGALVASGVRELLAVLHDGRVVVTRAAARSSGEAIVVLDRDGGELSRLEPTALHGRGFEADAGATTVSGNRAYVLVHSVDAPGDVDLVGYAVDECSRFQELRRLTVPKLGYARLLVSDGTIFLRENDTVAGDQRIVAWPDGARPYVAWRELGQTVVRAHSGLQLLTGPR